MRAGSGVEVVDGVVMGGEHEDVATVADGGPPAVDHVVAGAVGGRDRGGCGRGLVGVEGSVASPRRRSASAWRSQAACWRRLLVRVAGRVGRASPAKAPPASISGSWQGSPTSTTLAPAGLGRRASASLRVPTIAASSTTSTWSCPSPVYAVERCGVGRWSSTGCPIRLRAGGRPGPRGRRR